MLERTKHNSLACVFMCICMPGVFGMYYTYPHIPLHSFWYGGRMEWVRADMFQGRRMRLQILLGWFDSNSVRILSELGGWWGIEYVPVKSGLCSYKEKHGMYSPQTPHLVQLGSIPTVSTNIWQTSFTKLNGHTSEWDTVLTTGFIGASTHTSFK